MVHALQEAWRVLRAHSLLIDLRPAIEHGRVGLDRDGYLAIQWAMRESLASYRAASRSLAMAEALKLFAPRTSSRFSCTTVFPSVEDLEDWLHDWYEAESAGHADNLVRRVEKTSKQPEFTGKIIAKVPFMLKVLTKRDAKPLCGGSMLIGSFAR
jgi:hypothetical protein